MCRTPSLNSKQVFRCPFQQVPQQKGQKQAALQPQMLTFPMGLSRSLDALGVQ